MGGVKMLAFYLRLSKADDEEEESNSIDSQRELLSQSLERYGLLGEAIITYIDDGYSGKNLQRPGIIKLLKDIDQGLIQTVLVKDFSRFGRNYSEVSDYLEKKFPEAGIRFIAVNNGYDSEEQNENVSSMFQNILNDYYSEENSKKIRQSIFQLKKEGNYVASVPLYGYQKDLSKPYHLVVDQKVAEVVRLIFQMRCEGKSGGEIARYLNKEKIPSPQDYRKGTIGEHIWQSEVIWRMIRNREYLGNLVIGKYQTTQVGSRKRKLVSSDQWIEIENVHTAIIEKEIFEQAQGKEYLKNTQELTKKIEKVFCFKGLLICGGCGHKMKRKGQKNPFFFCKYYYYNQNPLCVKLGIKEVQLYNLIQKVLNKIDKNFDGEKIYQQYRKCVKKRQKEKFSCGKIDKKTRRDLDGYFLYEKWKMGILSEEVYQKKKKELKEEERENKNQYKIKNNKKEVEYLVFFAELLQRLIVRIFINSKKKIKIQLQIRNPIEQEERN